jgi:hypothetical protein
VKIIELFALPSFWLLVATSSRHHPSSAFNTNSTQGKNRALDLVRHTTDLLGPADLQQPFQMMDGRELRIENRELRISSNSFTISSADSFFFQWMIPGELKKL